ncbi:MAG TPA: tetratricopeptide repeat protein [Gammaproteobacteria bacterium]|nr:tetratricopeptide repeat protein [Gammaproteobacteria bacterium]
MDVHASEKEQVEALQKWWKANGSSLITGVLLGLTLLFGGKAWMSWREGQATKASNIYQQMQTAVRQSQPEAARRQANEIITNYSGSGYAALAALTLARLAVEDAEPAAARTQLEWALEHARTVEVEQHARLRLVRLLIDQGQYEEADRLLSAVGDVGYYRSLYDELAGDLAVARGELQRAAEFYQSALNGLPGDAPSRAFLRVKYENVSTDSAVSP